MKHLLICLLALTSFSCEEETEEIDMIAGNWEWVESYGGWSGNHKYTPENTGGSYLVSISPNYLFKKYRNDTLIMESRFTIEATGYENNKYIKFDDEESYYIGYNYQLTSKNSLTLSLKLTDSGSEYYSRLK